MSVTKPTITLTENDDGWWTARNLDVGVTTQGRTREEALENLDEAVAGVRGEGREPTDEELREMGIDPAEVGAESDGPPPEPDVPWFDE